MGTPKQFTDEAAARFDEALDTAIATATDENNHVNSDSDIKET